MRCGRIDRFLPQDRVLLTSYDDHVMRIVFDDGTCCSKMHLMLSLTGSGMTVSTSIEHKHTATETSSRGRKTAVGAGTESDVRDATDDGALVEVALHGEVGTLVRIVRSDRETSRPTQRPDVRFR